MDIGLPLLLLLYFHVVLLRVEEPELRRRFGSKYDDYCDRVPRWFPLPQPKFDARRNFTGANRR